MQAEQFDLAIQMQGSGVYSNPFTLMLGARFTAGFIRPGDPPGRLDAALPFPEGHEARRNLALLAHIGIPIGSASPEGPARDAARTEFPLWPADHTAAEECLAEAPRPWIGIHTSARDATRRWPVERRFRKSQRRQRHHVRAAEKRDSQRHARARTYWTCHRRRGSIPCAGQRPEGEVHNHPGLLLLLGSEPPAQQSLRGEHRGVLRAASRLRAGKFRKAHMGQGHSKGTRKASGHPGCHPGHHAHTLRRTARHGVLLYGFQFFLECLLL
jgi:hypothetical protein